MFDRLMESDSLALVDFGEDMTVIPQAGAAFPARMIWNDAVDNAEMGMARGAMSQAIFQCAPETATLMAEGDQIETSDGKLYAVFEIIPHRGMLTEIRVVER